MPADLADAKAIFLEALECQGADELLRFLEQACGADAALRERVEELLRAHRDAGAFLGGAGRTDATSEHAIAECAGSVIDSYKLVQEIGAGGMGSVWMAQQTEPVKRLVALKVIKPGMDSKQVLARFEAERQALALMDHPNIARALDAGATPTGRPYFVMELVKGVPLTKYCDEHRLTPRARLELFIGVCQAIQHAHQKGIIHRDIKPSNVLVALYDGKPVPKVIDFGIAKATGQQLTEKTLITGFGGIVGTLEYMSPEQAELNQLDIDTRSDLYSLGVLLYELLTGSTPLEKKRVKETPMLEVLRLIREEEPPRPSTRLSESKDTLPTISAQRQMEPARLTRLVRGELDWIVMKALEKDRNRRYESANDCAMDIRRYLADEPVQAGPPGTMYRLRKFFRRHRVPVVAVALVLLALVAGMVGTTLGLIQANRALQTAEIAEENEHQQRNLAEQRGRIAQAVGSFLQEKLLGQADADNQADSLMQLGVGTAALKENPTVRDLLDRAASELTPDKIEGQFPNQPLVQAAILHTIGNTYRGIGEYAKGIAHLRRALELYRRHRGPDHPRTLNTLNTLGLAYQYAGELKESIAALEQVRDKRAAGLGADHPDTLNALHNLAAAYRDAGKPAMAIRLYEQVRDSRVAKWGAGHADNLHTLNNLASAYQDAGKLPEAIRLHEQVRDSSTAKRGPEHPLTLSVLHNLAEAYRDAGRREEAIRLFKKVHEKKVKSLGVHHPFTLVTLHGLALAYQADGNPLEAIRLFEQIRPKQVEKLGPDHLLTLTTLHNLALAFHDAGDLEEAIRLYEHVRDRKVARLGARHPETLNTLHNLALSYRKAKKLADGIRLLEEVREGRIAKLGADHPNTLDTLYQLGRAYHADGTLAKAIPLLEQARDGRIATLGADHPKTLNTLSSLAGAYRDGRRVPEAIRIYEELRKKCEQVHGSHHPDTLTTMVNLASVYRLAGKAKESIQLYEKTIPVMKEKLGADSPKTLQAMNNLAVAYWSEKRLDLSVPLFEEVLQRWTSKMGANHPETVMTMANLAVNYRAAGKLDSAVKLLEETRNRARELPGPIQVKLAWVSGELALAYDQVKQFARSEPLYREILEQTRRQSGVKHQRSAEALRALGLNLLRQKRNADAEQVLRECLAILTRLGPDGGGTPNAQWLLGSALLRQKKYTDAEPFLLAAWTAIERSREKDSDNVRKACLDSLIQLYDGWGKPGQAARWRKKQQVRQAAPPAK
jgi:serine/threonine protein kinase